MKIPLNWLREYVDITIPPSALIERLTLAGLEVSGTRVYGLPVPNGVRIKADEAGPEWHRDKIVTAKVLKVEQHPNADKLKLVTVEYGTAQPKVVVTGAPNIQVGDSGQVVILALTGSVLFDGHATPKKLMELKPTQLRGVPSDAMVCSGYELGTTEDHEGIILLPDDAPVGKPLADVMGDMVIEVDILPNMARCLSMLGVAREVAALTGGKVKLPAVKLPTVTAPDSRVHVTIEDFRLAARYTATRIDHIAVGESPMWMQTRLNYAGMRPINNIVDITNYVMLEWGQPLHAFDYDTLMKRAGGKTPHIDVRPAKAGESLTTLDKNERKLTPGMLVIADAAGPIALAGVMGGLETEVTATTKNILLESANFDFVSIRRTAKALDLASEASYRFSRGIHPNAAPDAAKRAGQLLCELAGGSITSGIVDCYPAARPPQIFDLRPAEVRRLLGIDIPPDEIVRILGALDFDVSIAANGAWKVHVPDSRVDFQEGPCDLIEEVVRVYGYDRLPATLLADPLPAQLGNVELAREERLRDLLVSYGLQEFITYSLTTPGRESPLSLADNEYLQLLNPISSERHALRQTVLAGVLECAAANLKHGATVRAFEIGPVFLPQRGDPLPLEPSRLAVVLVGPREESGWNAPAGSDYDFYDIKAIVERMVADLHLSTARVRVARPAHLHPGKAAELVLDQEMVVGTFGELHPKAAQAFDFGRRCVLVGEFDLTGILAAIPDQYQYAPVPRFPAAFRDVAVVVDHDVPAERLMAEIRAGGGELLAGVRVFDLYRGPSIPEGTKSLAFALTYQAPERTLTDKEVDKAHRKIEDRLQHVLKAAIRGKE